MSKRRDRLIDCNPSWVHGRYRSGDASAGPVCGVHFECPEGHAECWHTIPFSPALDGSDSVTWQANGAQWQRFGATLETLTLIPSIRREQVYPNRDAAIATGAKAEYLSDSHFCALHINITDGNIVFHGDSR